MERTSVICDLPKELSLLVFEYMIPPTVWVLYDNKEVLVYKDRWEAIDDQDSMHRQGKRYFLASYPMKDWWKPIADRCWGVGKNN